MPGQPGAAGGARQFGLAYARERGAERAQLRLVARAHEHLAMRVVECNHGFGQVQAHGRKPQVVAREHRQALEPTREVVAERSRRARR